jgi:hypothetical protein
MKIRALIERWIDVAGRFLWSGETVFPVQQMRVFVEVVPCPRLDVVSPSFDDTAHASASTNHFARFKLSDDTVHRVKFLCDRLSPYVISENIFLFLCKTMETAPHCPKLDATSNEVFCVRRQMHHKDAKGKKEPQSEPRAVVFLECENADAGEYLFWEKKDGPRENSSHEHITWFELKRLYDLGNPIHVRKRGGCKLTVEQTSHPA